MNPPPFFQLAEGYAIYCPVGKSSLAQGIEMVGVAIAYARDNGIRKLLVDVTKLEGVEPPNTPGRFQLAEYLAEIARSVVIVALVAPPELIDPRKFGITVARNRGLLSDAFTDRAEALAWLLQSNPT